MIDNNTLEQVKRQLFGQAKRHTNKIDQNDEPKTQFYAVIDGAASPQLRFKLYDWQPQSCCLWSGKLEPDLEEVAPYMVKLQPACAFTDWLLTGGWDRHWHIVVETPMDFKACRKHLRKFLQTKSPTGETLLFRFYDPRVMVKMVPKYNAGQAAEFYENITAINYQQGDALIRSYFSTTHQRIECQPQRINNGDI